MSTTLKMFLSGTEQQQEEEITEKENKEASGEDPEDQKKRNESIYEGNNESQDIDSTCKEAFVSSFPLLSPLPPIKSKKATSSSSTPPDLGDPHPFAPFPVPDQALSHPLVIIVPADQSVILHKQVNSTQHSFSTIIQIIFQIFGSQPQSVPSISQQTLIIPYHPIYTGGITPPPPTPPQDNVYSNLDISNPNWLPGLPRPPPGVHVDPPRNRSKRERLRYLSQQVLYYNMI